MDNQNINVELFNQFASEINEKWGEPFDIMQYDNKETTNINFGNNNIFSK